MDPHSKLFETIVSNSPVWTELRFHERTSQSISAQKGRIKQLRSSVTQGVGIRVLVDGNWGFASTSDFSASGLERALKRAIEGSQALTGLKRTPVKELPSVSLARGNFVLPGYVELKNIPLDQKVQLVLSAEEKARNESQSIQTAQSGYNEIFETKWVVTSDGANARSQLVRNEFRLTAFAESAGQMAEGHHSVGKTGPWECLFLEDTVESMTQDAAHLALDLLKAPRAPGGLSTLILSPAMVGILCHEAIGHTVEADFVLSGSVAADKIGNQVASELVTLVDSGTVSLSENAGGDLLVDDEGVLTQNTHIIRAGLLESYLHNRESAALFGVQPTGSARAWMYSDEPLIRMRNTYIIPGTESLEAILSSTKEGYLVDCPLGGQADATGEFTFSAQKVIEIKDGKLGKLYRGATISGQAFEVLKSVDAVSREFKMDLGSGYCGKGQPAKVDAGGPYLRCKAVLGGIQT